MFESAKIACLGFYAPRRLETNEITVNLYKLPFKKASLAVQRFPGLLGQCIRTDVSVTRGR